MEARLNPSLAPRFWELDPIKQFQPLCVDLLTQEPGIASADEYGINGQGQRGIDILGKDINGQIIVVGQCKRSEKFGATEVIKAADEFYKYSEYWKEQGVTRFILIVACDLSDRKIQDEIRNQRTRFTQIGIHFEDWSGSILRNKLMPHPAIAQRHIRSQEVLTNICGSTIQKLVFTPNASIETTLQELREAMREPDRYYPDIKDLFLQEAKKINSDVKKTMSVLSSLNSTTYNEYFDLLTNSSEKLVRLSAALITWDNNGRFINILIKVLQLFARQPIECRLSCPQIHFYPLSLIIYTFYIIGVEYQSTELLQRLTNIIFPVKIENLLMPKSENEALPRILRYLYYDDYTESFFRTKKDSNAPICESIRNRLLDWLKEYLLTSPNETYYCGEFVLSLNIHESSDTFLLPALYIYEDHAQDTLVNFMMEKMWLKELFVDIEDRLQLFDRLSISTVRYIFHNNNDYRFYGNSLNLYQNY